MKNHKLLIEAKAIEDLANEARSELPTSLIHEAEMSDVDRILAEIERKAISLQMKINLGEINA